jgi:hypothetical protein
MIIPYIIFVISRLNPQENQEFQHYLEEVKPLPKKYRFFEDKRELELGL